MPLDISFIVAHVPGKDKLDVEVVVSPSGGGVCPHEVAFLNALKQAVRGIMNKHNVLVMNDDTLRELAPILDERLKKQGAPIVAELLEQNKNYVQDENNCEDARTKPETLEPSPETEIQTLSGKRVLH